MQKSLLPFWSSVSGAIAVSILALAAHFLPNHLETHLVSAVTTAAQIQLFHAILSICLLSNLTKNKLSLLPLKLIFFGSIIFAGSIYILALNSKLMISALKIFGPVTPIGGVFMIIGWFILAYEYYKNRNTDQ